MMVFACPKCDKEFPTSTECRAHIRACEDEEVEEDGEIPDISPPNDEQLYWDERVQKWAA